MTSTSPQRSKDGPLRRPHRHRNRLQGSDTPPLFARRRIVSKCTTLVLPSNYKRKGLGPFLGEIGTHEEQHPVTRTLPCRLRATSQAARITPRRYSGLAPSLTQLVTPYYKHFDARNTRSISQIGRRARIARTSINFVSLCITIRFGSTQHKFTRWLRTPRSETPTGFLMQNIR